MFNLSVPEITVLALVCLPIVLLFGDMLKKMGYSDLAAITLAVLILTPLNMLVLAYLVFFKWPIQQEVELLRRQVDEQASVDGTRQMTGGGRSNPLHVAIRKGYADVVEALISQGVDVDAKTADGQTPLELAIACKHDEIVELLRQSKAAI